MANLYSGTVKFTGFKSLSELTDLTFSDSTKYKIQIVYENQEYYVREGTTGQGYIRKDEEPFDWTYDGVNDLYIGNNYDKSMYINVSD